MPERTAAAIGREQALAAIRRERETRHWTIQQWKDEYGGEDWPRQIARTRREADAAVDHFVAAFDTLRAREAVLRGR